MVNIQYPIVKLVLEPFYHWSIIIFLKNRAVQNYPSLSKITPCPDLAPPPIPLYHIGKDKSSLLNIELIEAECFEVFHSDENDLTSDVSSDEDD